MATIEPSAEDSELFTICLSEGDPPAQVELKAKIDWWLDRLATRRNHPERAKILSELRGIAQQGLTEADGRRPDPEAAAATLNERERAWMGLSGQKPDDQDRELPKPQAPFILRLPRPDEEYGSREIVCEVTDVEPSADQLEFKSEVESTLATLQIIIPEEMSPPKEHKRPLWSRARSGRYAEYQNKLLGIAQVGLMIPAKPSVARPALKGLQQEILAREGPRIKNAYMKRLGAYAAVFGVIAAVIYFVGRDSQSYALLHAYRNMFVLWFGTMVGTWLSFGVRRVTITFGDLANLESDMVEPAVRLIFTGLLVTAIALIFICGMVKIDIGDFHTADLLRLGSRALLIGILLGVSEQALPRTLTQRASQFIGEIGGKT